MRRISALERERKVKEELVRLTKAIRKKYKDLSQTSDDLTRYFAERAKPIVTPLQKTLKESIEKSVKQEPPAVVKPEDLNATMEIATQTADEPSPPELYLKQLSKGREKLDHVYGVRVDGKGGTVIGDSKIQFSKSKVFIQDRQYQATVGLLELLFMQTPNKSLIEANDLKSYKEILILTNAHRQMYSAEKHVNRNKGKKYTTVISILFPVKEEEEEEEMSSPKVGKGMSLNVNSLVNRLRVLVLSKEAGHTGHDDEIKYIIDSLRSKGTIY